MSILNNHDFQCQIAELTYRLLLIRSKSSELHSSEIIKKILPGLKGDDFVIDIFSAVLVELVIIVQVFGLNFDEGHGCEQVGVVDGWDKCQIVVIEFLQPST